MSPKINFGHKDGVDDAEGQYYIYRLARRYIQHRFAQQRDKQKRAIHAVDRARCSDRRVVRVMLQIRDKGGQEIASDSAQHIKYDIFEGLEQIFQRRREYEQREHVKKEMSEIHVQELRGYIPP